ncbi:MAG TPA: phage/plasmid primase, P4 family [Steroidobacteraceae bacterium]|nr:phage/plasmid primase, P4 family [Steroidobacteraceae bacterium]
MLTDTDIANARRLAQAHGQNIRFTEARGWLVWDYRRWAADDSGVRVQALAKETATSILAEAHGDNEARMLRHARRSQSRGGVEAMTYLLRSEPGILVPVDAFDSDPWLLNVANGTLDLRTGTLRPHAREDHLTKVVSIDFDESAECPLWNEFLNRITGQGEELRAYLGRLAGYLLTGVTTEQTFHFLYGEGANGKSVYCEIIAQLLGEYAMIGQPQMIMARRHSGVPNDIARLKGMRGVLMNETSHDSRFDEARLKDLTGTDSLTGRFLNREFFDFAPTHKLLLRGNHKPTIVGTDKGIWRRLHLIPFIVSIPEAEQDRQLLEKLRAELPGILRWAVTGCLEWRRLGLAPPSLITQAVDEYRHESDTLGRFIEERCQTGASAQVQTSVFFTQYREYCQQLGEPNLSQRDLAIDMERRGYRRRRTTGGARIFGGIDLNATCLRTWSAYSE